MVEASLREQKKRRVRANLIENAIALFRERGFEATRVHDIVAPLELCDATFFNYFPNKDAVLSDWVGDLLEAAFSSGQAGRSRRARSSGRAAARWLADCIARDAEWLSPLWHRVRHHAGVASPAVCELIAEGQAEGELRCDLPARQLADLLVAGLLSELGAWLAEPSPRAGAPRPEASRSEAPRPGTPRSVAPRPGSASLGTRLQASVDLVLDGARKRNERVRPPAVGDKSPTRGLSGAPG